MQSKAENKHNHPISVDCYVSGLMPEQLWPTNYLSEDELRRLKTFSRPQRRNQFVTARILLRRLLSAEMGLPHSDVGIGVTNDGKPFCTNSNTPTFSISHCGDRVVVALSTVAVGVDLEALKTNRRNQAIADSYFSASEAELLRHCESETKKSEQFNRLWVMKEALAKMSGEGISACLQQPVESYASAMGARLWCDRLGNKHFIAVAALSNSSLSVSVTNVDLSSKQLAHQIHRFR
ncbi:4'-phosphopantetheinyl transferase family protein [Corallincola platygyrae]|uniref:4'-phosphopantetheinyl transferase family protein n=1 Tax=Corallincola platygyrae TaxID=1193278 RepID=A0ABW4XGJ8_9GAMM